MSRILVWDLPVRLFHWLLAAGFLGAAGIALLGGEHHPLFPYHGMIGLTLGLMVVLRVVWGFVGTRYARFGSFVAGPGALAGYVKGLVAGDRAGRHTGHNPGSAYAILAMLGLVLGLAVTGVMMARGNEGVKEAHEIMVYAMLAVVGVHLAGVALHTARYRENIVRGMVVGLKLGEPGEGIASARPLAAAVFLALVGAWAAGLLGNYAPSTQSTTVPLLGTPLQLGEGDGAEHDEDDD